MKNHLTLFLYFCAFGFIQSQTFQSVNEGFEVQAPSVKSIKTSDDIAFVQGDAVFTFTEAGWSNKPVLRRLNLSTMDEEWRVEVDQKWKYNNLTLEYQSVAFLDNGNIAIIGRYYNKKQDLVDVYARLVNEFGVVLETHRLTSLVAHTKYDAEINAFYVKNHFVIYSISDVMSNKTKTFHAAWVNDNFEEVRKHTISVDGGPLNIKTSYNAKEHCLYLTAERRLYSHNTVKVKSNYLFKFDINEAEPIVKDINFIDFKSFSTDVEVDTTTGELYLFGMAGPNKSYEMNSTFVMKLDPHTLDFKEQRFYPIFKEVVTEISDSKTSNKKSEKTNPSVSLRFNKAVFSDNKIYVIFKNGAYSTNSGQFIVEYRKNLENVSQYYLSNYGYGFSIPIINEQGNLQLFFTTDINRFNKTNPEESQGPSTDQSDSYGLFDVVIEDNKKSYRNIFVINSSSMKMKLRLVAKTNNKISCFIDAGEMGFIRASEL